MLNHIVRKNHWVFAMPMWETMRRLGGSLSDEGQAAAVLPIMHQVYDACRPMGMYSQLSIVSNDGNDVVLEEGSRISSPSVAKFMGNAKFAWLGVATIGNEAAGISGEYLRQGDGANGLIADACASECAEAAFEAMQRLAMREYLRTGCFLDHRRFSCGYGGWQLTYQRLYFNWFPMDEIGVTLTESCIMVPEKTITAIGRIDENLGQA